MTEEDRNRIPAVLTVACTEHDADPGAGCWTIPTSGDDVRGVCGQRIAAWIATITRPKGQARPLPHRRKHPRVSLPAANPKAHRRPTTAR